MLDITRILLIVNNVRKFSQKFLNFGSNIPLRMLRWQKLFISFIPTKVCHLWVIIPNIGVVTIHNDMKIIFNIIDKLMYWFVGSTSVVKDSRSFVNIMREGSKCSILWRIIFLTTRRSWILKPPLYLTKCLLMPPLYLTKCFVDQSTLISI